MISQLNVFVQNDYPSNTRMYELSSVEYILTDFTIGSSSLKSGLELNHDRATEFRLGSAPFCE
jgi:hypothetical protein